MEWLAIAVRWALYVMVLGLFGAAATRLYAPSAFAMVRPRRAMAPAAGASIGATAIGLAVLTAQMTGAAQNALDPNMLKAVAGGTAAGLAALVRLLALASSLVVLAPWSKRVSAAPAAAASLAWGGHAAVGEGAVGLIRLGVDVLHLLAAGTWLGALIVFTRLTWFHARDDVTKSAQV